MRPSFFWLPNCALTFADANRPRTADLLVYGSPFSGPNSDGGTRCLVEAS